ncbi:MAG: DUF456 domain-containing protein [Anaerolineae bacterium]|nr:DUF456 domain-containing protein [Anaerolineae bacterium]
MDWSQIGHITLLVIVLATMLFGLASLVTVIVPGLTIIWVAALVYALVDGLNWTSGIIFALITLLMIGGNITDNVLMGANARQKGTSWLAIGIALLGGVVGSALYPPFGGIIAALVGVFLVELIRLRDLQQAWVSLRGMAAGLGWAVVARLGIGTVMILLFCIWAFLVAPAS